MIDLRAKTIVSLVFLWVVVWPVCISHWLLCRLLCRPWLECAVILAHRYSLPRINNLGRAHVIRWAITVDRLRILQLLVTRSFINRIE